MKKIILILATFFLISANAIGQSGVATKSLQTISINTLTIIKQKLDSLVNSSKSKTVVLTFTSSNAGTLTVNGAVIMTNTLSPQNFSINLGSGSWELTNAYNVTTDNTVLSDLYFYSTSFNAGNDNSATTATSSNLRTLLGYTQFRLGTGGQSNSTIYSTFVGGSSIIFNQSVIYAIPNYRSAVTPPANMVYTYVLSFKRRD